MKYLEENFRNIVLSHMLEFEILYSKAKINLTVDMIQDLKSKLLLLLFDYYTIIVLFEKDDKTKNEKFNSIKQFEDTILKLPIHWDSLDEMKEIYNQIIKRISEYIFKEKT